MSDQMLPTTETVEDLADFWSTHDLTDFESELEEIEDQVFDPHLEA